MRGASGTGLLRRYSRRCANHDPDARRADPAAPGGDGGRRHDRRGDRAGSRIPVAHADWPLCLDRLERTAPQIPTLLLTSSSTLNELARIASPVPLGFTLTMNAVFSTSRGYEYSAPDQHATDLVGPVVTFGRLLGRKVVVWTVDDPARMAELAGIGIDGLISDRPDLLVAAFPG